MRTAFDNKDKNKALMKALDFDAEDLDANRHGYLSKKQRRKLGYFRRRWKWVIGIIILLTPLAFIYVIVDGIRLHSTTSSTFGNCLVILTIACGISLYTYRKIQQFNNDLLKGDVFDIGGAVRKYYLARRGQDTIDIAGKIFRTSDPYRFYGFILGEKYRIYYVPFSKYVLSAEPLEQINESPEIPKILKSNPPID